MNVALLYMYTVLCEVVQAKFGGKLSKANLEKMVTQSKVAKQVLDFMVI